MGQWTVGGRPDEAVQYVGGQGGLGAVHPVNRIPGGFRVQIRPPRYGGFGDCIPGGRGLYAGISPEACEELARDSRPSTGGPAPGAATLVPPTASRSSADPAALHRSRGNSTASTLRRSKS